MRNRLIKEEVDIDRIKYFRSLSVKEKLDYLEQLNEFFRKTMPSANRKIWEKLKKQGF